MHIPLSGNESGLVGYWPLNEGNGNITYDKSSYENDGTISGAEWNSTAPTIYGENLYTQGLSTSRVKLNIENNSSTPTLTIAQSPTNGTLELNSTLREYIYIPTDYIDDSFIINANEIFIAYKGETVKYSTPGEDGCEYIAICLPAFSPDIVNRNE